MSLIVSKQVYMKIMEVLKTDIFFQQYFLKWMHSIMAVTKIVFEV